MITHTQDRLAVGTYYELTIRGMVISQGVSARRLIPLLATVVFNNTIEATPPSITATDLTMAMRENGEV